MKLTKLGWFGGTGVGMGRTVAALLLTMMAVQWGVAQAVSTTTVQGTVYLANGQAGAGTVTVSWPSFTTANGLAVAAGRTAVTIAPDGFLSVNLTPNLGATPAGLYYTAVFQMSDGSANTQYWVVPAAAQATLAAVQAQLMPATQAVQAVSKTYVDQSISELTGSLLTASGGSLSGPLYLNGDPVQAAQAATKHYVDAQVGTAVPLAGGSMTGALQTPTVNGVQAPTAASGQTTLQQAMTAAGTTGAMEIPPTYAGTDTFTNPNGVRVTDLRTTVAQQTARSVKEFGAVCDGVTDDTNALQAALNYANAHGVALTIPEGTCKTRTLNWHGESIGGLGKQVSALMGFPGQDVLATVADSTILLSYTRLHDLTIYVDQSVDVSCSAANGRAAAGSCGMNRPMESNTIFAPGGNGQTGAAGTGAAWAVGNCAIAMPAATGAGGNGLKVAEIENVEIAATGTDPMAAQYPGAHSTHTCGIYLAQWPQWSEFRNIDIRGLNTGVAIPALPGTTPAGLNADSNRWQDVTIAATHAFTAAAGSNDVLDNVVALAGNSAATGETPTGLVLDLPLSSSSSGQGWTVRNAVVMPTWVAVEPKLTVTAAGGAVTGVTAGPELGLGFDPYGTTVPVSFSGACTAQAAATVNANGSIGAITVTQGGVGCSATTTASVNAAGTWDTAAPVNLIGGQDMTFYAGNLLKGMGGYTVWNATGSGIFGTQLDGGGGNLPGGGTYSALVANSRLGTTLQVDEFPGADFGAKVQACVNAVSAQYGGDCDARNFTGTLAMGSNVTISTPNTTVQLPCATIATANQMIVTAGTRNVTLRGCSLRGASTASGSQGGTVFLYSGAGAMVQVGDPTYAVNTMGFHLDNVVINTTASTSATAEGLAAYRTQEMDLESLYFMGNANQTGMTLDGTGNYTGGTFYDNAFNGFQTAVNAIGHQIANAATTDWMNASTFVRLHIDCPTSNGTAIAGTYGINLQQGDGNTFTGGDVESCGTAMHLGANAQNNTIVGLRNENSISQVVADTGSSYNNWMTGGTMFTGALTDNGTRNSFMDSFHRSFNGMNGDYYGSQQDATVTNHFRLGTGAGNERGLLNRYQTDSGYRWTTGLSDATAGEQYYQVLDELNNVYRLSIGQYNNGQSSTNNQTVINAAGTGAVVLNGSNNAGTGGVQIGSGGPSETTVATISSAGNAQFNGTLGVGGTTTFSATPTVKNLADAEIDTTLQAGLTASQKESLIYKDWNGASQWYAEKDASNNWELNSAVGGLDSFKAYQSTNSGDTYVNASNTSGAVRINYETGSGTAFDIYGGGSSNLYASFSGTTTIKFPGLAAGSGHYCLQVDSSGYLTNTGAACGTGNGNGTVSSGTTGQIAYYTASGTSVAGVTSVPLTAGGTGATSATSALANLGGVPLAGGTMTGALTATQFNGPLSGNATTATALAAAPVQCATNKYATGVSASGAATCTQVTYTQLSGTAPTWNQSTTGNAANVTGTVALGNGGTGATTAATAFTNIVAPGGALTGALTAPQFNGPLTGNVTGNVSGTAANVTGTVALGNGGTGAMTAAAALTNLLPGMTADGSNGFVATGNAQSTTLQVTGTATFSATPQVKNQADAEIDSTLWAGLTRSQKESLIYKDWNGNSQWYAEKDASNNWELNSGVGGLDSFKAYQSTSTGDTYVDASNATGAVRVNYETGSGTAFDVYNGNNGTLLASFAAPGNVEFPSLAAGSGHSCLQVDSSGYITNTGSACGSATGGNNITVSTASAGAVAYYSGNGTSISGMTSVPVTAGGTGATSATTALANLGALPLAGGTMTGTLNGPKITSSLSPMVNVLAYGADPTQTNDSTAAITNAITAACNAYVGSGSTMPPVFFPPGRYLVHDINIAAIGGGVCQPYLYSPNDNAVEFVYNGPGGAGEYMLEFGNASFGGIQGIAFNGENISTGALAEYGVVITSGFIDNNFWIRRSHFANFWNHAIYDKGANALNWHMDHLRFDSIGGCSLYIQGTINGSGSAPVSLDSWTFEDAYPTDPLAQTWLAAQYTAHTLMNDEGTYLGDGTHWGDAVACINAGGGIALELSNARVEFNAPQVMQGNNDNGMLVREFGTLTSDPANVTLENVGGWNSVSIRNTLVSSAEGAIRVRIIPGAGFAGLFSCVKNVATQNYYGNFSCATGAEWSWNMNTQQESGIGLESGGANPMQKIESLPLQTTTSYAEFHAGDLVLHPNSETVPGAQGPMRWVTAPLTGACANNANTLATDAVFTAGSTTISFTTTNPNQDGIKPGDNYTLVGAGASGANLNVQVVSVSYTANTVTVSVAPSTSVNPGTINWQVCTFHELPGAQTGSAAPTTGTWAVGERVYNTNITTGQPIFWTCSASGIAAGGCPGAWVTGPAYGAFGSGGGSSQQFGSGFIERSTIFGSTSPFFCCNGGYTHEGLTASTVNTSATLPMMLESTSGTTAGSLAGWAAANQSAYYVSRAPTVTVPISFASSSDYASGVSARIVVGLAVMAGGGCTAATLMGSDTPACWFAAVRYSNTAGDSSFMCVSGNGSAVNAVPISGAVPTLSYPIYAAVNPTPTGVTCTVTINGTSYSATSTSDLPGGNMGPFFMNASASTTAVHILAEGVNGTDTTF